jgi:hypothetical protein
MVYLFIQVNHFIIIGGVNILFVNDNCIEEKDIKKWIDNDDYFAGVRNGEEVFIAFKDSGMRYTGFYEFNFIKIPHDYKELEKNDNYDFDLQFIIISRDNPIINRDIKHYLNFYEINHIYTKEYLKNVVLKNLDDEQK